MLDRIDNLIDEYDPSIGELYNILYDNPQLINEFFSNFSKSYVPSFKIWETDSKRLMFIHSNKSNIEGVLINQWKSNISFPSSDNVISKDGNINVEESKQLLESYKEKITDLKKVLDENEKLSTEAKEILDDISVIIKKFGFDFTGKELSSLFKKTTEKSKVNSLLTVLEGHLSIETIITSFANNQNPFTERLDDVTEGTNKGDSATIKRLANLFAPVKSHLFQKVISTIDNKQQYSILNSNYLSKLIARLKNPKLWKSTIEYFTDTLFYKDSPLLSILENSTVRENLQMILPQGKSKENAYGGKKFSELNDRQLKQVQFAAYYENGTKEYGWFRIPTPADNASPPFIRLPIESRVFNF